MPRLASASLYCESPLVSGSTRYLTCDSLSFVGLLIYSIISWRRFKKAAQRGQYAPTLNPAASSLLPQNQTANPYQQNTAYNPPTGGQIELQNTYQPAHQGGAAAGYYNEPNKPAYGA